MYVPALLIHPIRVSVDVITCVILVTCLEEEEIMWSYIKNGKTEKCVNGYKIHEMNIWNFLPCKLVLWAQDARTESCAETDLLVFHKQCSLLSFAGYHLWKRENKSNVTFFFSCCLVNINTEIIYSFQTIKLSYLYVSVWNPLWASWRLYFHFQLASSLKCLVRCKSRSLKSASYSIYWSITTSTSIVHTFRYAACVIVWRVVRSGAFIFTLCWGIRFIQSSVLSYSSGLPKTS